MGGHLAGRLCVRCAVSRSGRAICENLQHGSPTAITGATSVTAKLPPPRSKSMRGRHDNHRRSSQLELHSLGFGLIVSVADPQPRQSIVSQRQISDGPEGDDWQPTRARGAWAGEDGDPITSCVIVPVEISKTKAAEGPRLTKNQQTMFSILHDAGRLTTEQWNECARAAGMVDGPQV